MKIEQWLVSKIEELRLMNLEDSRDKILRDRIHDFLLLIYKGIRNEPKK